MTATIAGVRPAVPMPLTTQEWLARLAEAALDIAGDEGGLGPWNTAFRLAHPSLCVHELYRACQDYAEAVRVKDWLASDADLWPEFYPALEGPGQRDAARQIAEDDVADTLDVLLRGRSR